MSKLKVRYIPSTDAWENQIYTGWFQRKNLPLDTTFEILEDQGTRYKLKCESNPSGYVEFHKQVCQTVLEDVSLEDYI